MLAVGLALAGLSLRTAARQDRCMDRFEAAMAAHRNRFEDAMAAHRTEMHRLAEHRSHVEGGLDEPGAAADRPRPSGDAHGRPGPNRSSNDCSSSRPGTSRSLHDAPPAPFRA